ncbi:MAG: phosphoglucosamine mutase [Bacteroidota bacterium]
MSLMVSISGIRGIVGESLTPEVVTRYAAGFGSYCKQRSPDAPPTVIIGRDGRISGRIFADTVSASLQATGVHVRNLGICPTPTIQLAVEREGAAGGISITASHNPIQWNGLKFIGASGMFLDAEENRELLVLADTSPEYAPWNKLGRYTDDTSWLRKHIDALLDLPYLDIESIRSRRFNVVLDCINAAGGLIIPTLLEELGCWVTDVNCDVSGIFSHSPEPVPENLTELATLVKSRGADLGIAVDPDVDRLVLITERGEPYGEEYTIASAVRFVLGREATRGPHSEESPPTVVVNLSTTRAVDDIAAGFGARVVRTPVGEINVAKRMKELGSVIGGEGSGGVILPAVHLGRDAVVGIGLLLQLLADAKMPLSQLKATLPQYAIAKGKIEIHTRPTDSVLETLQHSLESSGKVNTDDGLKVDFPEHWLHLRRSNTEPIIRIIAEAKTEAQARSLVTEFSDRIAASLSPP